MAHRLRAFVCYSCKGPQESSQQPPITPLPGDPLQAPPCMKYPTHTHIINLLLQGDFQNCLNTERKLESLLYAQI